ncbi:MAG TPA: hypothetical protein VFG62_25885 [Rhodopila sp.]|nr:hypothetical protein [Rhodopila sp.]
MFKYLPLVALLLATPALAQSAPQSQGPSPQAIIQALHAQSQAQADQLTLATAGLLEDQQKIADLQKQIDALKVPAKKPGQKAK